jgi:hypothetical protein
MFRAVGTGVRVGSGEHGPEGTVAPREGGGFYWWGKEISETS